MGSKKNPGKQDSKKDI